MTASEASEPIRRHRRSGSTALAAQQPSTSRAFVTAAVALTVLSLVSPLALTTDATTKVTLEIAHLVAAALVIPMLARKLAERAS